MEREIHRRTAEDGFRIAYSVESEGPPLVVRVPMQTKRMSNGDPTMRSLERLTGK